MSRVWIVKRVYRDTDMILGVFRDMDSAYEAVQISKKTDIKSQEINYIVKDYPIETMFALDTKQEKCQCINRIVVYSGTLTQEQMDKLPCFYCDKPRQA